MRLAVIDTGTNSTRLLVADVAEGRVNELERLTEVTRLGAGVDRDGRLHPDARKRVSDCVARYAERIRELEAGRTLILATSSVRDAGDGVGFLGSIAEAHGFDWKLLTGEEEAELSFSGATLDQETRRAVTLFDVGGGSTEVVSGSSGDISFARSLAMGCVRITERFISSDPVTAPEFDAASRFIDDLLDHEIDRSRLRTAAVTIAVAGTATALAAIDLGLLVYERHAVHGHVISVARIGELLDRLGEMTAARRLEIPTMEQGRADVIVAGTLILHRLLLYTGAGEMRVSELDILDGAAVAAADGRI